MLTSEERDVVRARLLDAVSTFPSPRQALVAYTGISLGRQLPEGSAARLVDDALRLCEADGYRQTPPALVQLLIGLLPNRPEVAAIVDRLATVDRPAVDELATVDEPIGPLPIEQLNRIRETILGTLGYDPTTRNALLIGLPVSYRTRLPGGSAPPAIGLQLDLMQLNTSRLVEGVVPLKVFLMNAVSLVAAPEEIAQIEEALLDLDAATGAPEQANSAPLEEPEEAIPTPGQLADPPSERVDDAALDLMAWADSARTGRGGQNGNVYDVVVGALAWAGASLDGRGAPSDPAVQQMFRSLRPDPAAALPDLVRRAVAALNVSISPPVATADRRFLEAFKPVLVRAAAIARRTSGAQTIAQRHLMAAALTAGRLPDALVDVLGVDGGELAILLCAAAVEHWPDEPLATWQEVLGLDSLETRFASDYVFVRRRRAGGPPAAPLSDHLDVRAYVTLLAATIARKSTAMPLSIGLFGEWGSGKSYFMELLRQEVDKLKATPNQDAYHREIVQVTFNAWSYADTNLWASLAAEFFEQLNAPEIDPNDDRRTKIKARLVQQNRVRQELEQGRQAAARRTEQARARYVVAVGERERKSQRFSLELVRSVLADPAVGANLRAMAEKLGFTEADTGGVLRLADEVRGAADEFTATRTVLARRPLKAPFFVLLAVLAVTALAVLLVPQDWAGRVLSGGTLTAVTTLLAGAGAVIGSSRRLARQLRDVAEQAETKRLDMLQKGDVAGLADELHRAEIEEAAARAQVTELESVISQLERDLDDLEPGRRLYQFIAERAASVDYRSELGVVSTVRRDFEQLVELMQDWAGARDPGAQPGERPIDRIVLYIDDLDRCEPDQVVQVLQAVHLLLAMDLFVVVVGVDPRWLLRALRRRYRGVLGTEVVGNDERSLGFAASTPQNYLEKIFQIPFVLPGMSPSGFGRLIRSLADAGTPEIDDPRPTAGEAPRTGGTQRAEVLGEGGEPPASLSSPPQVDDLQPEVHSELATAMAATDASTGDDATRIVSTPVTAREVQLLSRLSGLVRTPRAATRLFNIYGILRSSKDLSPGRQFLGSPGRPGDYQAVAQLLAILSEAPHLMGPMLWGQPGEGQPDTLGLCRSSTASTWPAFVNGLEPKPAAGAAWGNDVVATIDPDEIDQWREIVQHLRGLRDIVTLTSLEPYRLWGPQVARFSFLLSPFAAERPTFDGTAPSAGIRADQ